MFFHILYYSFSTQWKLNQIKTKQKKNLDFYEHSSTNKESLLEKYNKRQSKVQFLQGSLKKSLFNFEIKLNKVED